MYVWVCAKVGLLVIAGVLQRVCVPEKERKLTLNDLEESTNGEIGKFLMMTRFRQQDSDAAGMYN